jgi:hypothetical protein
MPRVKRGEVMATEQRPPVLPPISGRAVKIIVIVFVVIALLVTLIVVMVNRDADAAREEVEHSRDTIRDWCAAFEIDSPECRGVGYTPER